MGMISRMTGKALPESSQPADTMASAARAREIIMEMNVTLVLSLSIVK